MPWWINFLCQFHSVSKTLNQNFILWQKHFIDHFFVLLCMAYPLSQLMRLHLNAFSMTRFIRRTSHHSWTCGIQEGKGIKVMNKHEKNRNKRPWKQTEIHIIAQNNVLKSWTTLFNYALYYALLRGGSSLYHSEIPPRESPGSQQSALRSEVGSWQKMSISSGFSTFWS